MPCPKLNSTSTYNESLTDLLLQYEYEVVVTWCRGVVWQWCTEGGGALWRGFPLPAVTVRTTVRARVSPAPVSAPRCSVDTQLTPTLAPSELGPGTVIGDKTTGTSFPAPVPHLTPELQTPITFPLPLPSHQKIIRETRYSETWINILLLTSRGNHCHYWRWQQEREKWCAKWKYDGRKKWQGCYKAVTGSLSWSG